MVTRLHEFKFGTKLATRLHCFAIEQARCNRHTYVKISFSQTSHLCNSIRYLAPMMVTVFKYLSATSIIIFRFHDPCSFFIVSSTISILNLLIFFQRHSMQPPAFEGEYRLLAVKQLKKKGNKNMEKCGFNRVSALFNLVSYSDGINIIFTVNVFHFGTKELFWLEK